MIAQAESDNIWRTLGRLEEGQHRMEEGQRRLEAALEENQRRFETRLEENQRQTDAALLDLRVGLRDVNRRVDRLFFAIIAIGGTMIVATFASRFVGT
jgi:hypothetical protein